MGKLEILEGLGKIRYLVLVEGKIRNTWSWSDIKFRREKLVILDLGRTVKLSFRERSVIPTQS